LNEAKLLSDVSWKKYSHEMRQSWFQNFITERMFLVYEELLPYLKTRLMQLVKTLTKQFVVEKNSWRMLLNQMYG